MTIPAIPLFDTTQQSPLISRSTAAPRGKGSPITIALLDNSTSEVTAYSVPRNPSERTNYLRRERVVDVPWFDTSRFDIVPSNLILSHPDLLEEHTKLVEGLLLHLLAYYRPDLVRSRKLMRVAEEITASAAALQEQLAAITDIPARWNAMLTAFISVLDEKNTKKRRKAKRDKGDS